VFSLEGRVALITGAASGIGAATARAFARAGANLALAHYPADGHDIDQVVLDAEALGAQVTACALDVREAAPVKALADAAVDAFGRVDVVVANAGIALREPAPEDVSPDLWSTVLDVNLTGVWHTFQAAIPHMRQRGYGRLLATTSVSGPLQAWVEHSSYSASKAGLIGLVHSLAVELGPAGITVNAVAPGVITSPQSLDSVNTLGPDGVAAQAAGNPVKRVGIPEDAAAAFQYLASTEASYVTGHTLVVDGGRWLAGSD
jgi:3-oxoacyl-[acyl-carrier protein] reductase